SRPPSSRAPAARPPDAPAPAAMSIEVVSRTATLALMIGPAHASIFRQPLEIHEFSTCVASSSSPRCLSRVARMKVEVTYEALVGALIETIRNERDQGKALMRVMSRLMEEAGQQGRLANGASSSRKKRTTARRTKAAGTAKAS